MVVGDLVKGLTEVKKDCINLLLVVEPFYQIVDVSYKLALTRPSLSESMFFIVQDVVHFGLYEILRLAIPFHFGS